MAKRHVSRRVHGIGIVLALLALIVAGCGSGGSGNYTKGDIKIGWLSSLTGPLSAAAIGEDRGVKFAVQQINNDGGINGRKIKLVVRDTQGDPTRAVSSANELIQKERVDAIIGPVNSGEALPVVPVIAKSGTPNIIIGTVDSLTNAKKYPNAFRTIATNEQWVEAAAKYLTGTLQIKKIAILGDTTGYGTATVDQAADIVKAAGGSVSYKGLIDPSQTDVTSDIMKARASGADALMVWSAAAGLDARIINTRTTLDWDVPIVGHPALSSGDTAKLLSDRANWSKVYSVGYRSMSTDASGSAPKSTKEFVDNAGSSVLGKSIDYTLWWAALGYDSVQTVRHAIEEAGSTDPKAMRKALEQTSKLPGVFGTYSWSPQDRNGFPTQGVVMNEASSFKDGIFELAPGYK